MEEATAPAWIERISPLDDQALADRYMLHKLLGMPDAALADAMELQRRQARKSGRPDPDYANSVAYYLADFPDYLPQAEAQARRSIRAVGLALQPGHAGLDTLSARRRRRRAGYAETRLCGPAAR